MRPLTTRCDVLDFADELRAARAAARRHLGGRPREGDVAGFVADHFAGKRGEHGGGYATARTGFGGRRWHYLCSSCRGRAQRLFRPIGWEAWCCGRCARVRYPQADRGWRRVEVLAPLVAELERFKHVPGRRPRRHRRMEQRALALARFAAGVLVHHPAAPT